MFTIKLEGQKDAEVPETICEWSVQGNVSLKLGMYHVDSASKWRRKNLLVIHHGLESALHLRLDDWSGLDDLVRWPEFLIHSGQVLAETLSQSSAGES